MMKKAKRLPHKIYVFGNSLLKQDSLALSTAKRLEKEFPKIKFVYLDPNEEIKEKNLLILDVASGIKKVSLIKSLNQLDLGKKISPHDFDLAFSLKLMKKVGLIKKIEIMAIPIGYNQKKAYEEVKKYLQKILYISS